MIVEIELGDVLEFISDCDSNDYDRIVKEMHIDPKHEAMDDISVETLDQEFQLKTLIKLYKASTSIVDLESMLTDEAKDRIKYL